MMILQNPNLGILLIVEPDEGEPPSPASLTVTGDEHVPHFTILLEYFFQILQMYKTIIVYTSDMILF